MANISIKELTDAIQKSGLPVDSGANMQDADIFARESLDKQFATPDFGGDQLRANYQSTLAKIAEMDKKLAGVYGDPTSPLFIERASTRDRLINSGPAATGYKAAGNIATTFKTRKAAAEQEREEKVNQAVSLYSKLTTMQLREEARAEKAAKAAKKGSGKAPVDQALGQIKKGRYDLAGLVDPRAIEQFEAAPPDFQAQWVREYQAALDAGDVSGNAEENYYTPEDIIGAVEAWRQRTSRVRKEATSTEDLIP